MIPDDVVVGLPVAARFRSGQKNVWHRGLILGPVVDSVNVEVNIKSFKRLQLILSTTLFKLLYCTVCFIWKTA